MISDPERRRGLIILIPLFLLAAIRTVSSSSSSVQDADRPTVYDILQQYGLPRGLLPDSVSNYSLSGDGSFLVELPNTCYIQFDYLVYYDKRIRGKLSYGSITGLHGIEVKRFFLWLDVSEIKVKSLDSDSITFQAGIFNKELDVSQFTTVHSCRDEVNGPDDRSGEDALKLGCKDGIQMLLTE